MTVGATATVGAAVIFLGGIGSNVIPPTDAAALDRFVAPLVDMPFSAEQVIYPALPWNEPRLSAPQVAKRVQELSDDGRPVVVYGLSWGGQVAGETERLLAADPSAPQPGSVRFIHVADPASPTGGIFRWSIGPDVPAPKFDTEFVAAEYDGIADFPDRPLNLLATLNAVMGVIYLHPYYGTGGDNDPLTRIADATVTVDENPNGTTTTTRLIPTDDLPLTRVLRDFGVEDSVVDEIEKPLRVIVDQGYERNDPHEAKQAIRPESGSKAAVKALGKAAVTAHRSAPKNARQTRRTETKSDEAA